MEKWRKIMVFMPKPLKKYVEVKAAEKNQTHTQTALELMVRGLEEEEEEDVNPTTLQFLLKELHLQGFEYGKRRTISQDYMADLRKTGLEKALDYLKERYPNWVPLAELRLAAAVGKPEVSDKTARTYAGILVEEGNVEVEYHGKGGKKYLRYLPD